MTKVLLQLIDVGFFVCFDSFLSLLTIMPTRILMTLWRLVRTRRSVFSLLQYFSKIWVLLSSKQCCEFSCHCALGSVSWLNDKNCEIYNKT